MDAKKDNSKKYFIVTIALIALFGLAIVAMGAVGVYLYVDSSKPESSLTVEETVTRSITPDTATATFVYNEQGEELEEVNSKLDEVVVNVTNYLKEQGIEDKDIKSNKNSYPDYRYFPDGTNDQVGFNAEVNFEVTFRDLESEEVNPNAVLDGLVELGINQFYGFNYSIDDTESICKELEDEAIEKAIERAKKRVDSLGGGRIIKQEIPDTFGSCGNDYGYPFYAVDARAELASADSEGSVPELNYGEQELSASASVKVTYK